MQTVPSPPDEPQAKTHTGEREERTVNVESHEDITSQRRFANVAFYDEIWDLGHLDPFAFREEIKKDLWVDVVVFFECHCFTHGYDKDLRDVIPKEEVFMEGNVRRVLNRERWLLSRALLPDLVQQLRGAPLRVLGGALGNFASFRAFMRDGTTALYGVFLGVKKDSVRKGRLIMRIQSAYPLYESELTNRMKKAGKVNLNVLLRATYEGRQIRS